MGVGGGGENEVSCRTGGGDWPDWPGPIRGPSGLSVQIAAVDCLTFGTGSRCGFAVIMREMDPRSDAVLAEDG